MKASELRIGNFYNQFGNITEVDWSVLKELKDAPLDQLWCKPILLTEEWLLKLGFKKVYETCYQYKDFEINDKFIMMDIDITIQLKYVHSLQNLYFALTSEELTIKK